MKVQSSWFCWKRRRRLGVVNCQVRSVGWCDVCWWAGGRGGWEEGTYFSLAIRSLLMRSRASLIRERTYCVAR